MRLLNVVLMRESNEHNTIEIKEETSEIPVEGDVEQDPLGLVDIPPLPDTPHPLPDATVNRLVELPGITIMTNLWTQPLLYLQ